jgi:hypothetical protein
MKKKVIFIMFYIGTIVVMQPNVSLNAQIDNTSLLRHNGVEWIYFGKGIIDSSKLIEVSLYIDKQQEILKTDDFQKILKINQWISANFRNKLNYSPSNPLYESVEFINFVTLYSSVTKTKDSILLKIPLTPLTLSCSQNEFENILIELRDLYK